MNLSDTFYVALCMTVLILGVVYWFWTQNQYIQRKLNLLENIVFELKSGLHEGGSMIPDNLYIKEDSVDAVLNALTTEAAAEVAPPTAARIESPPPSPAPADIITELKEDGETGDDDIDLAPGGSTGFTKEDVSDLNNESVLNAMGLKELRELAKQKGVSGAKTLRKHELVAAIRASKTTVTPFEIHEGVLELS